MERKIFEADGISLANLKDISMRQAELLDARVCEISFIAQRLAASVAQLTSAGLAAADAIAELYTDDEVEVFTPRGSFVNPLHSGVLVTPDAADGAVLSALLLEKLDSLGVHVTEADYLDSDVADETFTYVRGALSDEAYDVFSQEFDDPRVSYSATWREACLSVADGNVGYCILPFEERGGVRVPIISELAAGLGLKIVAVTPVFGFEGNADMKYALLKRGFVIPDNDEDTDRYLEIKLPGNISGGIPRLFSAAEGLGVSVYRINTLGDTDSLSYSVIFKDGGGGFAALLTYLSVFIGEYLPIGIYKNLE